MLKTTDNTAKVEESKSAEEGKSAAAAEESPKVNYNNSEMELMALEQLREQFPTTEAQQGEVTRLISGFGSKTLTDRKFKKAHPTKVGKTLTATESGAEKDVLDIMCLAQMIFEGGNKFVMFDMQDVITGSQRNHARGINTFPYPDNLEYLQKCLINFKPAIYENLRRQFSERYGVPEESVQFLPKATGQQVGTKVIIPDTANEGGLKAFYVKSHQEFCSKSHPQLGTRTSNGLGYVDLKELLMYKVLERTGYGPKTEFMTDRDVSRSRVEEGIMIVTQDSGYTKTPASQDKSFKTFGEIKDELSDGEIDEQTKMDVSIIDALSRIFLLDDVMVNEGNFGRVDRVDRDTQEKMPSKWKVIDFKSPQVSKGKQHFGADKYNYTPYYGGKVDITYGFSTGNYSHDYSEESPINSILRDRRTQEQESEVIKTLESGRATKSGGSKDGIEQAVAESFQDIIRFLETNSNHLSLKDGDDYKPQTQKRIEDLSCYCACVTNNFHSLIRGVREEQQSVAASRK